ncbi:hypothetical protein P3T18_004113 [Paraburkholderia sp. GAS199]|uniref:NAD(P)(+) transhydrogenase (Re/Si-specific) subunit beta n=1 Tax=Paraburkholderia sp. GAS199 TaxID=3035126 RepID=UPI003D226328
MLQASDSAVWTGAVPMAGLLAIALMAAVAACGGVRGRARRSWLIASLGSVVGLTAMGGGLASYLLSATAFANLARAELYAAVSGGALVFATSLVALCKLRGLFDVVGAREAARPGHDGVNLLALSLCAWLGFGFITGQAQPSGLAALLAASVLSAALGVHVMLVDRGRTAGHAAQSATFAFAGRSHGYAPPPRDPSSGWLDQQDASEFVWPLRDSPTLAVRSATHRHSEWRIGQDSAPHAARHRSRYGNASARMQAHIFRASTRGTGARRS